MMKHWSNKFSITFHTTKKKSPTQGGGFYFLVEPSGIEPLTSTLPVLRSPS